MAASDSRLQTRIHLHYAQDGVMKNPNKRTGHSKRIAKFHTLEKTIAQTHDPTVVKSLKLEQERLGGLQGISK